MSSLRPSEHRDALPELPFHHALIIGASSGIGADLTRNLLEQGVSVVGAARRAQLIAELMAEVATRTGKQSPSRSVSLDVGTGSVSGLFTEGDIFDLFVDSAGLIRSDTLLDGPEHASDLAQFEQISVHGPVAIMRAIGASHLAPGGMIVNISSAAATRFRHDLAEGSDRPGFPGEFHYGRVKNLLSLETARYDAELVTLGLGQRAFAIEPGLMDTEEARHQFAHEASIDWARVPTPVAALLPVLVLLHRERATHASIVPIPTYEF